MKDKARLLIVDDSVESLELIDTQLDNKYHTSLVTSLSEARKKLLNNRYHIAIVDLVLPGENGLDLIRELSTDHPYTAVIAISGQASIEAAVMAMKLGAAEFLVKPLSNPDLINIMVEKTLQAQWLLEENRRLSAMLRKELDTDLIIGNSVPIQSIIQKLKKIAGLDTLALITGETGVGKSVFAELIHRNSPRRGEKFVSVNCGSLTETLLESLLFGHKRGAFTDANRDKIGYFQEANGGTLFLDEITETSLAFQVKLLKVLETGVYRAVGSDEDTRTDTRIIAASNKDIEALVKEGLFREDLYYRLNVINLHIPPLRERKDDIRVLASSFVQEFCDKYNKAELKISPGVMSLLLNYNWKGNIRELRNALEHAVIMAENKVVQPEDLPESVSGMSGSTEVFVEIDNASWAQARDAFSKHYIQNLLAKTGGNVLRAAAMAEITRENFYKKCTKLGINWRKYRKSSDNDNGGEI
ncbi:MAG: sigma-54 dependent transcriptional regulator [Candidatus Cloacimonadaceae bacterium]|jgi:DNA-binding NtrC family response regulator|nr:sigma-54 dependent transcriptional regulator [Candidatus Cloacimonadota bacterium]MDY0381163.1 sigma-54 dependent transcriptional regulator [Candidatus Cloacimonadaceae bacterium]MCB5263300.1 sigma-54 dependent transcriptional regulator [Candidatus Cloacimonadota bacterium]MCB5276867.1 sigma-54 dependent transcriptional regulator [Candidatus Cloacimonadota bacterium]MCK9433861.1 sigma-54 dependent transcriptional regulator [Candidatus Cloacimonadota bacterium]